MDELEALRARGAARCDPVRWRFIEALARRTQAQAGAPRQLLDARLQALLAAYASDHAAALAPPQTAPAVAAPLVAAPAATEATPAATPPATPDALQQLRAHLAQHAAPLGSNLQTLDWARRTWSRISVGRRMTQSLAKKPEKAGPINSHGLVLRALQQLGAVSPDYLDRFVAYADALLALDQATGGSAMLHRDVLHGAAAADAGGATARRPRPATRATARAAAKTADQPAVTTVRKR